MAKRSSWKPVKLVMGLMVILLATAIALPMIYKDHIVDWVKRQANERLDATVDFENASIGLLRSFPNVCLTLDRLTVDGQDNFSGTRLLYAEQIDLLMDIPSLLRRAPHITSFSMIRPELVILVDANGLANYDVLGESEDSAGGSIDIEKYRIEDGKLIYLDQSNQVEFRADGVEHEGSGRFSDSVFDLVTKTQIDQAIFESDGSVYLAGPRIAADALLAIDLDRSRYHFKDAKVHVNDLELAVDGDLATHDRGVDMNLSFAAPGDDIRQFISLLPGLYTKDFDKVKTSGHFSLSGEVVGTYSENSYPTFSFDAKIADGSVAMPDAPFPMERLNANFNINSTAPDLHDLTLDLPLLEFQLNQEQFNSKVHLSNLMDNVHARGEIEGVLDLAALGQALPLSQFEHLAGRISSDLQFDVNQNALSQQAYGDITADGTFEGARIKIKHQDFPALDLAQIEARLSPQSIDLEPCEVIFGRSSFEAEATVINLQGLLSAEEAATINLMLDGDFIDLSEISAISNSATDSHPDSVSLVSAPPNVILQMTALADQVSYETYLLEQVVFKGNYLSDALQIEQLSLLAGSDHLDLRGTASNVMGYLDASESLVVDADIRSRQFDLNNWYESAEGQDSATSPYVIPPNMELTGSLEVGQLVYTDVQMENLRGNFTIQDQTLVFEEGGADMLGGHMDFAGSYETLPNKAPAFRMKFDAGRLDFSETFGHIAFLEKLSPISKYINGSLNSNLVLEGDLTETMFPDLGTLTGSGMLETVNGLLQDFAPLSKVADLLSIKELEKVNVHRSINWFEVDQGMVQVKPFDFRIDQLDIDMNIAGRQWLDGEMEYLVQASIPRELLRENSITNEIDRGYGLILEKAQKMGLRLEDSEYVNVEISLDGQVTRPQADLRVVDAEGRTADKVLEDAVIEKTEEVKDSVRTRANEELAEVKDTLLTEMDRITDSVEAKVEERVDELKEEVGDKIKDRVEEAVDSTIAGEAGEAIDSVLTQAGREVLGDSVKVPKVEDIRKKLEDFNPFRKKKKKTKEG